MVFIYTAILTLKNKKYIGTLDFKTLKDTQKEYKNITDIDISISDIFKLLENMDMTIISILLIKSITRISNIKEEILVNAFSSSKTEGEIITKFENYFTYINELMKACMPKEKNNSESEFEEIPDFSEKTEDWDFSFMEYLWTTTLKRNDFWDITPKNFFEQVDIHRKINSVENEKIEEH